MKENSRLHRPGEEADKSRPSSVLQLMGTKKQLRSLIATAAINSQRFWFPWAKASSAAKIHEELCLVYGPRLQKWHDEEQSGRLSIQTHEIAQLVDWMINSILLDTPLFTVDVDCEMFTKIDGAENCRPE